MLYSCLVSKPLNLTFPFFYFLGGVRFQGNENVFRNKAFGHKGTLSFRHKFGNYFFKAISNSFGDNFIYEIAKAYGTEVFRIGWGIYFRYKRNESMIYICRHYTIIQNR